MSVSGTKEVDKTILLISEKRTDGRGRGGGGQAREEGRSGRKEAETTERREKRGSARAGEEKRDAAVGWVDEEMK